MEVFSILDHEFIHCLTPICMDDVVLIPFAIQKPGLVAISSSYVLTVFFMYRTTSLMQHLWNMNEG